jgi:ribosomal protein L16 Arg81 hydroxylase
MLPRLSKVLIALEQALQTNLQANIYITPANAQGFKLHYDTHDIFVIQLKGPKAWRIYDTSEDLPVSLKAFNKQPELVKELTMNAGDLLYLPRGVVHEAFTSDVATIHLNISFRNKYGFNLIEHLAQSAAENAAFFRKSPPLGQAKTSDIENYTKALNAALNSLVENAGAEKMLQLQKEQFIKKQTLDFSGRLLDIFSSENLNADTVICRRKNFSYIIKQKGNEGIICYGNYELIIPAIVDRASLLQEGNFKVKDINGLLTDNGKISLVRDYIEAGFFTIADT